MSIARSTARHLCAKPTSLARLRCSRPHSVIGARSTPWDAPVSLSSGLDRRGLWRAGPTGQFNEESRYRPSSPYSASKAGADHLARAWHRTYGLPVLVSNCSNNYGPYQFPEKLIPLMMLNASAGKQLPVYGQGLNIRDWLHVDDHVAALRRIVGAGSGRRDLSDRCACRGAQYRRCQHDLPFARRPQPDGAPHARLDHLRDRPAGA